MNDPALRLVLGISLVLGGVFVASLFTPSPGAPPSPELQASALRIRTQRLRPKLASPPTAWSKSLSTETPSRTSPVDSGPSSKDQGPVMLRAQAPAPLPMIPPKYPGDAMPGRSSWGMPAPAPSGLLPAFEPRTHIVVDGDTLPGLAEHYLGSAERAEEVYAANRAVLRDPDLLPIGVKLTIPPSGHASAVEDAFVPWRRLVPVPAGWQRGK